MRHAERDVRQLRLQYWPLKPARLGMTYAEDFLHRARRPAILIKVRHAIADEHAAILHELIDLLHHLLRKHFHVEEDEDLVVADAALLDLLFMDDVELAEGLAERFVRLAHAKVFLLQLQV